MGKHAWDIDFAVDGKPMIEVRPNALLIQDSD